MRPIVSLDYEQLIESADPMLTPECKLVVAMIQRAIIDITHVEPGRKYLQHDAAMWIYSPSRAPWSLWWCCEIISSCPDALHRRIQQKVKNPGERRPKYVIMRVDR